jgi:hypothetical protein
MSSFPATAFNNTLQTGYGSPLYIIQTDITKTLESPNSINEIIDGTEADAAYSNILRVPEGAIGFTPFLIVNATVSGSTTALTELNVNVTATSANPLRYMFIGRIPDVSAPYRYGASDANLASALQPSSYGFWHGLGAWRLVASTGAGTANYVMYGDANNASAAPAAYSVPTASGNDRQFVASLLFARTTGHGFETLLGLTTYPGTTSTVPSHVVSNSGVVPLLGCTHITAFGAHSGTAPTIAITASASTGTITVNSTALAIRFIGEGC